MTDRSIESDLKEVQQKLKDIEKKQEIMNKLYQLDIERKNQMGERPSTHLRGEMT